MSLPNLINIPKSPQDWEEYVFNTRNQIQAIQQAILTQKNINLTQYVIYPVSKDNFEGFLQANQQSHEDFNSVLGLQSSDIETVNPEDDRQLSAWVYLVYQELFSASSALGI